MKTILTHCRNWLCAVAIVVVWLYAVPSMDKLQASFPGEILQAWADARQRKTEEQACELICSVNGEAVPVSRNGNCGCVPRRK